jgi:arginase
MREFLTLSSRHRQFSILPTLACHPTDATSTIDLIARTCQKLADQISVLVREQKTFLVLGGDHSSAIGTWSGVRQALAPRKTMGLLWVDAHMDSHTFETSPSSMIHGMPLAALLGYGDPRLTHMHGYHTKLDLGHLCLVGVRSFEVGEARLLERLGVRIFYMEEILSRGLIAVMQDAMAIVQKATGGFGISIDMDAFDPSEIPAVGSPVHQGIDIFPVLHLLKGISRQTGFLGTEIAEFNPELDLNDQSAKLLCRLIDAIYS